MIKQSQISNFLDLIKHISEIKEQAAASCKKKKNQTRYQKLDEENDECQPRESAYQTDMDIGTRLINSYQQKKLRGFLDRRKNNRSLKFERAPSQNFIENEMTFTHNSSVVKERKNLFELYCQDIQKKREDKFKGTLFTKITKENSPKSNWEDDIVAQLERYKGVKSLHRQKSMPPIGKVKPLKGVTENTKIKRPDVNIKQKKHSAKKMQPSQLNIGTIGEFKIPKISHNSIYVSELKYSTGKIPYLKEGKGKKKNIKITNNHDLTGWAKEEDNHKFFHHDLF